MSDPDLHRAFFDLEVGVPDRGQRAGRQADSNASGVVDRFLCRSNYLIQGSPGSRFCLADFPHENFAGDAAAFFALILGRRGDVVIGDDGFDLDALFLCHARGHFYVHVVAGIVPVKAGDALSGVGSAESVQKRCCGRR